MNYIPDALDVILHRFRNSLLPTVHMLYGPVATDPTSRIGWTGMDIYGRHWTCYTAVYDLDILAAKYVSVNAVLAVLLPAYTQTWHQLLAYVKDQYAVDIELH